MLSARDEGPVYYREIQKNAYLKRIPSDNGGSKLRPLGHKKLPLKPMWTLFCVHNGRTPFLEQYPDAENPATLAHKPIWRACLRSTRHVTASVKPHVGDEYDFLVDTDHGPVRMLAPDWDSMQDWVTTLRSKLLELKIVSRGENVYCAPPAAPPPRAAARDPTSPLPPTPPGPPHRVPGIELTPTIRQPTIPEPEPPTNEPTEPPTETQPENIDISNWDPPFTSQPSTSQEKVEPTKSVAKICGQNICLDDSILKRTAATDSDEEFFAEIDRIHSSVENLVFDEKCDEFKQRVVVNDGGETSGSAHSLADNSQSEPQATNITVIQVLNKPPHTAIPVMGPETDIFDFNFKQKLSVNPDNPPENPNSFINIVNTEVDVQNSSDNGYGTVFTKDESEYGHISLTTTVNLIGDVKVTENDGIYERLCLASTSNTENVTASPLPVRKLKNLDKNRKSSLPNLDIVSSDSTYEYLFPNYSQNRNNNSNTTNITLNFNDDNLVPNGSEINSNVHINVENKNITNIPRNDITNTELINNITSTDVTRNNVTNTNVTRNNVTNTNVTRNNITSTDITRNTPACETSRSIASSDNRNRTNDNLRNVTNTDITRNHINSGDITRNNIISSDITRNNINSIENTRNNITSNENTRNNVTTSTETRVHVNLTNSISVGNTDLNSRLLRSNVERSHSQNAYDISPRHNHLIRRVQNQSPKRDGKSDKSEAPHPKPIWKRGLTELSLLSRLRGIGQAKRQESPTRHENEQNDRGVTSPAKVMHRSRPEARVDSTRRRSSSLTNGQSPPTSMPPAPSLQPLRARQAAALRAEQRRGAAVATTVSTRDPKVFCDYNRQVWIAWWSISGARCNGRAGDRVVAVRGTEPTDANHARQLMKTSPAHTVDILFHRVPLGKIYVLNKQDLESIGIKLDNECNIVSVESESPAARAGLPPPGKWALTEVNNRPINLIKGGEEEMNRLSAHGSEVSVLIQPSALVKKIRAAVKTNKTLMSLRLT